MLRLLIIALIVAASSMMGTAAMAAGVCSGPEAYWVPDGRDYRGVVSTTRSGIPCQGWDEQTPHQHVTHLDASLGLGAHNYCRNPSGGDEAGAGLNAPWCYTTSRDVLFEVCNVGPPCRGDEATTAPVTFTPAGQSADGTSSSLPPVLLSPAQISLACASFNATIRYTLDNTAPSATNGVVYTGPISVAGSGYVTVRAFALQPGSQASPATSATYQIAPPLLPAVAVAPQPALVDAARPVLVSLALSSSDVDSSAVDNSGLQIRYRIVKGDVTSKPDSITITLANSFEYKQPFWVRASATVIAASFNYVASSASGNTVQSSAVTAVFYDLVLAPAAVPVVSPSSTSDVPVAAFGRAVFLLSAPNIAAPTFVACVNQTDDEVQQLQMQATADNAKCTVVESPAGGGAAAAAFSVTARGLTTVRVIAFGPTTSPSDAVTVLAQVNDMPRVRLSVPSVGAVFVGPTDVTASCELPGCLFRFFVNGARRVPPVALSAVGEYLIEAQSYTVFDDGPVVRAVVTLQAASLATPILKPRPGVDVPSPDFIFASPLVVRVEPLTFQASASFVVDVYQFVTSATAGVATRQKVDSLSVARSAANRSVTIVLRASAQLQQNPSLAARLRGEKYEIVANTVCDDQGNSNTCNFLGKSTTATATYIVAPTGTLSGPTFLLSNVDSESPDVVPSTATRDNVLRSLFSQADDVPTTASATAAAAALLLDASIVASGSSALLTLRNLSPQQAIGYSLWLAQDLLRGTRTARAGSLRLRLGLASSRDNQLLMDRRSVFVACLASTALSSSKATLQGVENVEQCSTFCLQRFPESSAIVATLSPPSRCDCIEAVASSFSSYPTAASVFPVQANNFAPIELCNKRCAAASSSMSSSCGGTVANPSSYGLWSSTLASAYLTFSASTVGLFPLAASWNFAGDTQNNNNIATTTSIFTIQLLLRNVDGSFAAAGDVVLISAAPALSCAKDAVAVRTANRALGYYSAAFGAAGLSGGIVVPAAGDYRVCVAFTSSGGAFRGNNTFVEVPFGGADSSGSSTKPLRVVQGQYYPTRVFPLPGTYYEKDTLTVNISTPTVGAQIRVSVDGALPVVYASAAVSITITGAGSHRIVASAVSSEFAGLPTTADYVLVPRPTVDAQAIAAYLAAARYDYTTTLIGSIRVSLTQVGTVQVGGCGECRVRLLPAGSNCATQADDPAVSAALGPYATAPLLLDRHASDIKKKNNNNNNGGGLDYLSDEMLVTASMSREELVVCVGGPPWFQIAPVRRSRTLSVAAAHVGLCSAQQDKMCQNGGKCSRVTVAAGKDDEFGCACKISEDPADDDRWTSLWCNNNSALPASWNGTVFDVVKYRGGGGGSGGGNNGPTDLSAQGSWSAFFTLSVIYGLSLGALWYHKTYRVKAAEEDGAGENQNGGGAVCIAVGAAATTTASAATAIASEGAAVEMEEQSDAKQFSTSDDSKRAKSSAASAAAASSRKK